MDYPKIGITTFATKSPGTGGILKSEPEDFVVQEILADNTVCSLEPSPTIPPQPEDNSLDQVHFTLVKRDWHQSKLIKHIARACGLSQKRFSYAGTKDKYALTSQRVSVWKVWPETLSKLSLKDVKIGDYSYSSERIELGHLWGNRFTVQIKEATKPENAKETLKELEARGGSPNFFGSQRFGMRLNNHLVGKHIILGDMESAVKEYLIGTSENEGENGRNARLALAQNWGDFKQALNDFPRALTFERAILDKLNRYPQDYVGAFKQLPKNLYKIFTHSYQSYLFNKLLSAKIDAGDLNSDGPLIGYETKPDKKAKELLAQEGITTKDFKVKAFPEASCKGSMRKLLAEIKNLKLESPLSLSFDLEKGAYATILLREILFD